MLSGRLVGESTIGPHPFPLVLDVRLYQLLVALSQKGTIDFQKQKRWRRLIKLITCEEEGKYEEGTLIVTLWLCVIAL